MEYLLGLLCVDFMEGVWVKKIIREFIIWKCFIFGGHTYTVTINGTMCSCGLGWDEKHPTDWRLF